MTAGPPRPAALAHYDDIAARVGELSLLFETHPDPLTRERVEELLQAIDALHRAPLRRLVALLETYQWDGGASASIPPLDRARTDPLIRRLLELYDLAPPVVSAGALRATLRRDQGNQGNREDG